MRLLPVFCTPVVALVLVSASPAATIRRGHPCGSFVSKNKRLYVYVTHGRASCAEARRIPQARFLDARGT